MSDTAGIAIISDDAAWCRLMDAQADAPAHTIGWTAFDREPLALAHPARLAVARLAAAAALLDRRLGQLCRAFPSGVVIELVDAQQHADAKLFAHGYRLIRPGVNQPATDCSESSAGDKITSPNIRCFEYRLRDYKPVPEWLNSRYWAHPERFNL